ncbi:DUF932 domain-containing protein [Desulfosudis oleivorans]|uniref:DUF932 domain-containing protein n=1 Tax=Desulfosudis oleivorans (strain DSM 6200 / JCM 39069 / Hxd3) TaxID=96561 RepID=A8ZS75_DESOH|nr:DUF932 domain-containing protein [Desulfosudis oleivorans]ABW66093.1 hypothetical protein Dole_0283 [Desulfosudis oleivorans Hxd3]
MKTTTTTLERVIEKVHEASAGHYDEVVPVQEMEFDSLSRMWIAGQQTEILPGAQRLLSNRLRVPFSYLSRCPANLQAENLNFWIEQERLNRETFFCRFDGHRLRAVFTERYKPLDNMDVLSQLLRHGFDPDTQVQYAIDDGMFLVRIPEYARAFGVNPGYGKLDEIVPGVSFANSEVGLLAFSIEAFFYRLVCTNGLISKTSSTFSRFKHISNRGLENFPETIAGVIEDSVRKQEQFKLSRQSPVENPIRSIETFARQFGLAHLETEVVCKAYLLEQGATMFHIINAFTRAAQDKHLDTLQSYRLESAGGQILSLVRP